MPIPSFRRTLRVRLGGPGVSRGIVLRFADSLARIRQGEDSPAQLRDVGDQLLFEIKPSDAIRRLVNVKLEAREYVYSTGIVNGATFTTKLDYDLYVNKLYDSLLAFNRDLRSMAPLD